MSERSSSAQYPTHTPTTGVAPGSVVIVGGGAASNAAAEMLRREAYSGTITMRDCTNIYRRGDRNLAVAVIHRDLEGLRAEVEFEKEPDANAREESFQNRRSC